MKNYYVYIMSSGKNGVIYIGVTNNLMRRVFEHKEKIIEGFTSKYHVSKLVYYEETVEINAAIEREKKLKGWKRHRKIRLIEEFNPDWKDLSLEF